MEHYVTLFDRLFLPQGMALHLSMERHLESFTLWILCVDDEVYDILQTLKLSDVRLLKISQLETEELLNVKRKRTRGEYCWTLTPFSISFVFDADPVVKRVTYVDADIWFRKKPENIFQEFEKSGKNVLITDHAYAPEYDYSATSGQYCVQFMTFTRDGGEIVRKWWQDRCLEWCYARYEDGKFGDQMYLDDWPDRFPHQVHVLTKKEYLLAPWNATRFPYGHAVCWHFHDLRILKKSKNRYFVDCGNYPLPSVTRKYIYLEYINDLRTAIEKINMIGSVVLGQKNVNFLENFKTILKGFWRQKWRFTLNIKHPL